MKLIVSHPTGNANVRAALNGFVKAGLLLEFHTGVAVFPDNFFDKLSTLSVFSEFKRRKFSAVLEPFTKTHPFRELGRLFFTKMGWSSLVASESGQFSIDAVYSSLDKIVADRLTSSKNQEPKAVYAFEDGAVSTFKKAKAKGLDCFYDLPIGYWRAARVMLEAEKTNWPAWVSTLQGMQDSPEKVLKKDNELKMADHIFVASTFTASTLKYFPGALCETTVIPYGFPAVSSERTYSLSQGRPLRLLFVGGLSQRKGLAYMFAAIARFSARVSLTVVGKKTGAECASLDQQLAKHKWIPGMAHAELLLLMRQHDVLLFPSLFEGFGLVITEAMSQGTPVITTERTAGPDIITAGEDGWLISAGSTDALANAIESLLADPRLIQKAGTNAMQTARNRPWEKYGEELARAIHNAKKLH